MLEARVLREAWGQVCERRALPAGTGVKAHPGQTAAPETGWATGDQPNCPRKTMGESPEAGRQSEVHAQLAN